MLKDNPKRRYDLVPTSDTSIDSESLNNNNKKGKGPKCNKKSTCSQLLKNKCCIACIVILILICVGLIGIKITISELLKENDAESAFFTFTNNTNSSDNTSNSSISSLIIQSTNSYSNETEEVTQELIDLETWEMPEALKKEVFYYMAGHDLENNPIWVIPFGVWDLKKVLTGGSDEENEENEKAMNIFFLQFHHRVQKSVAEAGTGKWVMLGDMDQYSYGQLWSWTTTSFTLKLAKKFEAHMETVAYGYILNLDTLSKVFVSMMKPILGSMMERLEPFGQDKEYFSSFLLKKIARDQLPDVYGGTAKSYSKPS